MIPVVSENAMAEFHLEGGDDCYEVLPLTLSFSHTQSPHKHVPFPLHSVFSVVLSLQAKMETTSESIFLVVNCSIYILLDDLVCSIVGYFYESPCILASL